MKLIITDIGGTLVKTDEAITGAIETASGKLSIDKGNREAMHEAFGTSIPDYIKAYLPEGEKDKHEEVYKEFTKIFPDKMMNRMKPFEGVDGALNLLSWDKKVIAYSCMEKKSVDKVLSLLDFRDFAQLYSIEDYSSKRPSPEGILEIARKSGVKPEEALYIGDTEKDIEMAKKAGMLAVAVRTGVQDEKRLSKADHIIDSFVFLPRLISSENL
ncbi:MAG: HAD family hydrolase [Nanobdellota archaeon]